MLISRQFRQFRWATLLLSILPVTLGVGSDSAIAQTAADIGQWSSPFNTPIVPIHVALGCNGKVLMWQRIKFAPSAPKSVLWNQPSTTSFSSVPSINTDIFCAGHDFAPSGRLLLAGGHRSDNTGQGSTDINVYDFNTNSWFQYPNKMNSGRWYPSVAYNDIGEAAILSGTNEEDVPNPIPQVWGSNGSTNVRELTGAEKSVDLNPQPYNWMFLAPNGKMFVAGPYQTSRILNTAGNGSWTTIDSSSQDRSYGSVVFYNVGKVMIIGGSNTSFGDPSNTVEAINLNASTPNWLPLDSMAKARRHHTATVLPDGNVLVFGGTSSTGFNNTTGKQLAAEMWSSTTGQWSTMASQKVTRTYHSSAVLLPNGKVASCGGGFPLGNGQPGDPLNTQGNYNCEIYSPPYLFKGTRPSITKAPSQISYSTTFPISTSNTASISKVSLIRLSSMTHGYNVGQRFTNLSFTKPTSTSLSITAPKSEANIPAGCYLLFVLNDQGVPSEGEIIKIN